MVSLFAESENGILDYEIIQPNADGMWTTEQLKVQTDRAIKTFEERHPGAIALFVFDNSTVHSAKVCPLGLATFERMR